MKKILLILMILAIVVISCASADRANSNIVNDAEYQEMKAIVIAELEKSTTPEALETLGYHEELPFNKYISWTSSMARERYTLEGIFAWYSEEMRGYYIADMEKTLTPYREKFQVFRQHQIEEYQQEEIERKQKQQEMDLLMVRGVPGDAKWIAFQEKFDMINLYATLIEQDNTTMAHYKIQQYHDTMMKDEKELSPLTSDQEKWVKAVRGEFFGIMLLYNTNLSPSFEHSRRNAITGFNHLMSLRAGQ